MTISIALNAIVAGVNVALAIGYSSAPAIHWGLAVTWGLFTLAFIAQKRSS